MRKKGSENVTLTGHIEGKRDKKMGAHQLLQRVRRMVKRRKMS